MIKTEQELHRRLVKIANRPCWNTKREDFCVDDYAGGNADDAFYGGENVGEVNLARSLLVEFFGHDSVEEEPE